MPKFAIYFIPEGPFYQEGTAILGYDIRGKKLQASPASPFPEEWVEKARPYGFHLTIGDAIDFEWETLPLIERELEMLLSCFSPGAPFELKAHPEKFLSRFGNEKEVIVLRYTPNEQLLFFHTMAIARVNPLGEGSVYSERVQESSEPEKNYNYHRIKQFYSPYILDQYHPHFTLFNPYGGDNFAELEPFLLEKFEAYKKIIIHSVCLAIQSEPGNNWEIYREISR